MTCYDIPSLTDCCEASDYPTPPKMACKKQEKKMNYMNSNYAVAHCCTSPTAEKQEKMYMVERLSMINDDKTRDLEKKFGLRDDEHPLTAEDFLQRIKDGKFTLRDNTCWDRSFYGRVRWRDPAVKEDQDGFDQAVKELKKSFTDAMDDVVVLPEIDGLAALKEFEAAN